MALTVQLQLNPRAKPFVPTVKANKLLQHRRGKREEGGALVSKQQTQLGRVRWASRRGEGEPNPPRETNSGANGGRYWRTQVLSFLFVRRFCLFVFFAHWSFVDVPLIFFCPADHVPDWHL